MHEELEVRHADESAVLAQGVRVSAAGWEFLDEPYVFVTGPSTNSKLDHADFRALMQDDRVRDPIALLGDLHEFVREPIAGPRFRL